MNGESWRKQHDAEITASRAGRLKGTRAGWLKARAGRDRRVSTLAPPTLADWRARLGASAWMVGPGQGAGTILAGAGAKGPSVGDLLADWKARKRRKR